MFFGDQLLIQQTDIGGHAHGHPGIGAGLKLQQEIQIDFTGAFQIRYTIIEIALAALQAFGVEFGIDPLHGAEV